MTVSFCFAGLQIGSIFEYSNKNPVFGLLPPSSPFYTPILGFFAVTGLPSAGELQQIIVSTSVHIICLQSVCTRNGIREVEYAH